MFKILADDLWIVIKKIKKIVLYECHNNIYAVARVGVLIGYGTHTRLQVYTTYIRRVIKCAGQPTDFVLPADKEKKNRPTRICVHEAAPGDARVATYVRRTM